MHDLRMVDLITRELTRKFPSMPHTHRHVSCDINTASSISWLMASLVWHEINYLDEIMPINFPKIHQLSKNPIAPLQCPSSVPFPVFQSSSFAIILDCSTAIAHTVQHYYRSPAFFLALISNIVGGAAE